MNQYEMKQKAYQSTLKSRALQVLVYLIDRSNKEGTCFPAISTMSRELHISVSTVKRAMRELVESGFVKEESRFRENNNGQTSNLYILCFAGIKKTEEINKEMEKKEHVRLKNNFDLKIEKKAEIKENKLLTAKAELISILEKLFAYCSCKVIAVFTILFYISYWPGEGANLIPP